MEGVVSIMLVVGVGVKEGSDQNFSQDDGGEDVDLL